MGWGRVGLEKLRGVLPHTYPKPGEGESMKPGKILLRNH